MKFEHRIIEDGAVVRAVKMPCKISGFTVPNDDGSYSVYINNAIPVCEQRSALAHELAHIEAGHFYTDDGIVIKEAEAELRSFENMKNYPA